MAPLGLDLRRPSVGNSVYIYKDSCVWNTDPCDLVYSFPRPMTVDQVTGKLYFMFIKDPTKA